jgi:DNA invertase Pin-like site-specific DNA recombinase
MGIKAVSYVRVSTQRQGASGLGLEAQKAAVEGFCRQHSCDIVAEYREVESGRQNDRPELTKAIAHAKRAKATLLIAKLDRLARNVAFIANLMDSGVDFRACDIPEANRLLLHIMAAVAENEARTISDRTKAALNAAKACGTLLGAARPGSPKIRHDAQLKGAAAAGRAVSLKAKQFYSDLAPSIVKMRHDGKSLREIAKSLDEQGHSTRAGKPWGPVQVLRVLERERVS